jgi:hypothetical protein
MAEDYYTTSKNRQKDDFEDQLNLVCNPRFSLLCKSATAKYQGIICLRKFLLDAIFYLMFVYHKKVSHSLLMTSEGA